MKNPPPRKPIRVCFVCFKGYPLFNSAVERVFGGTEVDLYHLATELARDKEFSVSFIVADYGQEPRELRQNVMLVRGPKVDKNFVLGGRRIWRALCEADSQIYFTQGLSLGLFLLALFCQRRNCSLVCRTARGPECDGTYFKQHPLRAKAIKWALGQAKPVITQNDRDAQNLSAFVGVCPLVIRNGQPMQNLASSQRRSIFWVGRSDTIKRPELFVELARQVPDQHFTLICQRATGDNQYDKLVAQARRLSNLEFIPRVKFHDVDRYFQNARVFVNTSDSEGFPNAFVQACKWATPILSLNVNPDNFLDKYQCGLCAHGDWELFVNMLRQLLDPETAACLGANGRRYAEENHDITKIIERYKEIFRQLAASPSG